ncbi:DUF3180 domain-containing protein [Kitasatospora sp. NBC_01250]|uniref:DUF3180 domain-containing protein n=1 Tax=unclassified Kitasatospora TaxID=2633591 RepID=UPI002E16566F|nr:MULTISPECIES: DUF3180 domain-containing protein [unclassified Kitasatospora]WSJ68657.1 DUF3180 domain-containing protein [Kitasatospora sp. NBC_01302]
MKPLRLRLLLGIFVIATALAWAGAKLWNSLDTLPGVPAAAPVVLAVIAVILLATAISLRSRLKAMRERTPGAKRVDPLGAARAVVLGQASALVSALVSGVYAGLGIVLVTLPDFNAHRGAAITAGLAVVAGAGVVAAALWLQHICKLPEDGGGHNGKGAAPSAR